MDPRSPFPCPFCRSRHVTLVGGGRQFLHYRCGECSEVWTAQKTPLEHVRARALDLEFGSPPRRRGKVSLH